MKYIVNDYYACAIGISIGLFIITILTWIVKFNTLTMNLLSVEIIIAFLVEMYCLWHSKIEVRKDV